MHELSLATICLESTLRAIGNRCVSMPRSFQLGKHSSSGPPEAELDSRPTPCWLPCEPVREVPAPIEPVLIIQCGNRRAWSAIATKSAISAISADLMWRRHVTSNGVAHYTTAERVK